MSITRLERILMGSLAALLAWPKANLLLCVRAGGNFGLIKYSIRVCVLIRKAELDRQHSTRIDRELAICRRDRLNSQPKLLAHLSGE